MRCARAGNHHIGDLQLLGQVRLGGGQSHAAGDRQNRAGKEHDTENYNASHGEKGFSHSDISLCQSLHRYGRDGSRDLPEDGSGIEWTPGFGLTPDTFDLFR
jgi:hypothetical protein